MTEETVTPGETVINDDLVSVGAPAELTPDAADEAQPSSNTYSTIEALNSVGVPDDFVQGAMAWLEHGPTQGQDELDVMDVTDRSAGISELRELWPGDEFDSKIQAVGKYLDQLPEGEGELILRARGPDGHAYMNDPALLVRLAGLASKPRPELGSGSVDAQIKKIEAFMKTNRLAYFRDESIQARYRELLTMRPTNAARY